MGQQFNDPNLDQVTKGSKPKDPAILVIFGAMGDLTKRLLMPAVYNLHAHEALPKEFSIIGISKDNSDSGAFREKIAADLKQYGTQEFDRKKFDSMADNLYYFSANFENPECYQTLQKQIEEIEKKFSKKANLLFYLAVSPKIFGMISDKLGENHFHDMPDRSTKIILEKPFGHSLESAINLDTQLHQYWSEKQIWRIDHYLGKETVQNLLAFRFGNGIFEPLWNRNYIDHIQITVAEEVGVEKRGSYFDHAGTLRDMVQNHLLQVVSYIAMEPPSSFRAETIRNAKVEVLNALQPMTPEEVLRNTVRGQYDKGEIRGHPVIAYRDEADVDPKSTTETFVALKLQIDNWRWAGVPFYLRTGKHLPKRYAEIVITFKKAPKKLFPTAILDELVSNELIFYLQPKQGIELLLKAKVPGREMLLKPVTMHFDYEESFHTERGTGYEVLLYDCLLNDPTLFSRSDLVERAWEIAQPIIDVWSSLPPRNFPNYLSGTWGPKEAGELIKKDGRQWRHV